MGYIEKLHTYLYSSIFIISALAYLPKIGKIEVETAPGKYGEIDI